MGLMVYCCKLCAGKTVDVMVGMVYWSKLCAGRTVDVIFGIDYWSILLRAGRWM
jgi:hypothetical protein